MDVIGSRSLWIAALLVGVACGPQVELGDTDEGSSGDAASATSSPVTSASSTPPSPPGPATNGPGDGPSPDPTAPDPTAVDEGTSGASMDDTGDDTSSAGETTDTAGTSTGHVPQCNDGSIDPGEQCDGENLDGWTCEGLGLDGGDLGCSMASCTFDTTDCMPMGRGCGDGMIAPGEQCDGADLQGFDCESLGLGGGTLGCDPRTCTFDTSMCDGDAP